MILPAICPANSEVLALLMASPQPLALYGCALRDNR
jgi:hypothetical protein